MSKHIVQPPAVRWGNAFLYQVCLLACVRMGESLPACVAAAFLA